MSQIKYRTVKLKDGKYRLRVSSPYHPDFPAAARKLGGSWQASDREWSFDPRDEARVKALCKACYGADGTEDGSELATVRVDLDAFSYGYCAEHPDCTAHARGSCRREINRDFIKDSEIFFCGRLIAKVWGRDGDARLGDGVVVIAGSFGSGGSKRYPRIRWDSGTVVEIRDVPRSVAEAADEYKGVTIVAGETHEPVETGGLNADGKELAALLALEDLIIHRAEQGELSAAAESAWATYQKLKELAFRPGTDAEGVSALKAAIKKAAALAL